MKRLGKRWTGVGLEWYAFPQHWSSTALGFSGIGGQAFTTAQTIVVCLLDQSENECALVYFGGRFAYETKAVRALLPLVWKQAVPDVAGAKRLKDPA